MCDACSGRLGFLKMTRVCSEIMHKRRLGSNLHLLQGRPERWFTADQRPTQIIAVERHAAWQPSDQRQRQTESQSATPFAPKSGSPSRFQLASIKTRLGKCDKVIKRSIRRHAYELPQFSDTSTTTAKQTGRSEHTDKWSIKRKATNIQTARRFK